MLLDPRYPKGRPVAPVMLEEVQVVSDRYGKPVQTADFGPNNPFTGVPIISTYTINDAVEDGMMAPIQFTNLPDTIKFNPGRCYITIGAMELFEDKSDELIRCLSRHINGDYGTVSEKYPSNAAANDRAIKNRDDRVHSSYEVNEEKVWFVTRFDKTFGTATTILLPSED